MTPTSTINAVLAHETVAVCDPDGGLITWKIIVRIVAVFAESVPGINVPLTPPRLAVMLVAPFPLIVTMIIAARFVPLPMTNAGVVTEVTPNRIPELTLLSYTTPRVAAAVTTSETVVVCVKPPLTPASVNVYVPVGVLVLVVTDRVDAVVAGFGVKLPLAPLGSPVTRIADSVSFSTSLSLARTPGAAIVSAMPCAVL